MDMAMERSMVTEKAMVMVMAMGTGTKQKRKRNKSKKQIHRENIYFNSLCLFIQELEP